MELCSILCVSLDEKEVWGRMDTCICMAESLQCPPETTTLLISYALKQNAFGVKKIKIFKKGKKNLRREKSDLSQGYEILLEIYKLKI